MQLEQLKEKKYLADLNTLAGDGMANPATRFHLWVYEARSDVNSIFHTHSPWARRRWRRRVSLSSYRRGILTQRHDDCAFLGEWPGVPIADYEGVVISKALGSRKAIILAHRGYLTAGSTIEEATYLSVYLERAARM